MSALYEGFVGSLGRFTQSWVAPSAIAVGLFALLLYPSVEDRGIFRDIAQMETGSRALVLGFTAVSLAVILAAAATPMYRVLEGYVLPRGLQDRWTERRRQEREALRTRVPHASGAERNSLQEKLDRYPRRAQDVLPTRLGNALRSGEFYGRDQYGLDTVLLYTRVVAVVPETVRERLVQSKSVVDLFVGATWLSVAWAITAIFVAIYGDSVVCLLGAPAGVAMAAVAYHLAVYPAARYGRALQALSDLGRIELAAALGLVLPNTLENERVLWEAVSDYVAWGLRWSESATWVAAINRARAPSDEPTLRQSRGEPSSAPATEPRIE